MITIVMTLSIVWIINEKPKNEKILWALLSAYIFSYLTIYFQANYKDYGFEYWALHSIYAISVVAMILIPVFGGIKDRNGKISWEIITAQSLNILIVPLMILMFISNNDGKYMIDCHN
jgi:cytochrome b561